MAEAARSIFNKHATEKLRSPDDLDKYVRVTNPGVWTVLLACIALLAGLLAWGVFGAVTTTVSTIGTVVDDKAMCFLSAEEVAGVQLGEPATVGGEPMTVSYVAKTPASPDELRDVVGSDYLVKTLVKADWAYIVEFEGNASNLDEGVPQKVEITTDRIAPIELILNTKA